MRRRSRTSRCGWRSVGWAAAPAGTATVRHWRRWSVDEMALFVHASSYNFRCVFFSESAAVLLGGGAEILVYQAVRSQLTLTRISLWLRPAAVCCSRTVVIAGRTSCRPGWRAPSRSTGLRTAEAMAGQTVSSGGRPNTGWRPRREPGACCCLAHRVIMHHATKYLHRFAWSAATAECRVLPARAATAAGVGWTTFGTARRRRAS